MVPSLRAPPALEHTHAVWHAEELTVCLVPLRGNHDLSTTSAKIGIPQLSPQAAAFLDHSMILYLSKLRHTTITLTTMMLYDDDSVESSRQMMTLRKAVLKWVTNTGLGPIRSVDISRLSRFRKQAIQASSFDRY